MGRRAIGALAVTAVIVICAVVSGVATGSGASVPECASRALTLSMGPPVSPMTGEHADLFELRSRAGRACVLVEYPVVRLSHGATDLPFVYAQGGGQYVTRSRPKRVVLHPGRYAYFLVAKYRCDGPVLRTSTSIHVALPASRGELTLGLGQARIGLDYCKRYAGDQTIDPGNHVTVSPVEGSAMATGPVLP